MRRMPVKTMFLLVETGAAVSMLALSFFLSAMTGQGWVLLAGLRSFLDVSTDAVFRQAAVPVHQRPVPDHGQHDYRRPGAVQSRRP